MNTTAPMQTRHLVELILLAALWSASFLFMRVSAPEFGPVPLVEVRTIAAALFLLPFVYAKKQLSVLITHWRPILVLAILTTALPYSLMSYSILYAPAGYVSILNATVPMLSAVVAFFWLKERPGPLGVMGLAIGFLGIFLLASDKASVDQSAGLLPVIATLTAALSYALSANYIRKNLSGISPVAISAGTQVLAAIVLLPFAIYAWPTHQLSGPIWLNAIALGVFSTAIALVLFYRLASEVGPTRAVLVAYLIPVFSLFWGYIFLGEIVTREMYLGGLLTLVGVAFTTGFVRSFLVNRNT